MKTTLLFIVVIVGIIFAMAILPSVQPMMESQAETQRQVAQRAAIDNQARLMAINERATAAAGEAFATATGVALQALATQTAVAISANATAAANLHQATATAEAQAYSLRATATAEPHNVDIAATTANTTQARDWLGVALIAVVVFAAFVFAVSGSGWLSTRGKKLRRGESIVEHGQVVNPERSVVPVTGVRPEEWLTKLWRIYQFMRTGELPEPQTAPAGNDVLTDPEHLLEAMRISIQPATMQEMFQPGLDSRERKDRIEWIELGKQNLMGQPARTQVVDRGAGTVILSMIRPQIAPLESQSDIVELSAPEEPAKLSPPPASPVDAVWSEAQPSISTEPGETK